MVELNVLDAGRKILELALIANDGNSFYLFAYGIAETRREPTDAVMVIDSDVASIEIKGVCSRNLVSK